MEHFSCLFNACQCTIKTSFNSSFYTDLESVQFFKLYEAVFATFNFIVKNCKLEISRIYNIGYPYYKPLSV